MARELLPFQHANLWVIIAETMMGNGARAFQYYSQINPTAENDVIDADPVWVRVTLSEESMAFLMSQYPGEEWMAGGMPPAHAWCIGEGEKEDCYLTVEEEAEEEFVPEWGSVALLGSGLAGLAGYATLRLRSGQALRWRARE